MNKSGIYSPGPTTPAFYLVALPSNTVQAVSANQGVCLNRENRGAEHKKKSLTFKKKVLIFDVNIGSIDNIEKKG